MNRAKCQIDTCANRTQIIGSFTHPNWAPHVKHRDFFRLESASKEPTRLKSVNFLNLQIGDLCIRGRIGVVKNLVTDLLLGALTADRYIEGIFFT